MDHQIKHMLCMDLQKIYQINIKVKNVNYLAKYISIVLVFINLLCSSQFQGPPVSYIQQIVVKSAVSPWKSDLILTDAFRAPLSSAFDINELINYHQISAGYVSFLY